MMGRTEELQIRFEDAAEGFGGGVEGKKKAVKQWEECGCFEDRAGLKEAELTFVCVQIATLQTHFRSTTFCK